MRQKFYGIKWKDGEATIESGSWDKISKKVTGVSGVIFKSFHTKVDATRWLEKESVVFRKVEDPYKFDVVYIFVDGSYSQKRKAAGWGWVAVMNDKIIAEACGAIRNPPESRNICGELRATMEAARWYFSYIRDKKKSDRAVIVHDYIGISSWALGYWEAKKRIPLDYIIYMKPLVHLFKFEKVNGHSGIFYNEYADELANKGYHNQGD